MHSLQNNGFQRRASNYTVSPKLPFQKRNYCLLFN